MVSSTKKPDPTGLLQVLTRDQIPARLVAKLVEISEGSLSAILSGRPTTTETKLAIYDALNWCRRLRQNSPVPVDFRKYDEIVALYREWLVVEAERDAVRQANELQIDAPVSAE